MSYCPPSYLAEEIFRAKMMATLALPQQSHRGYYQDNGVQLPSDMNGFKGIFICGGVMNIMDRQKFAYLDHVQSLIRQAHQDKKPILGTGSGALIIAHAFGVTPSKLDSREIGFTPMSYINKGDRDPLLSGLPAHHYFCFHNEFPLMPEELLIDEHEVIIETQYTPHAGFRIGKNCWGILPHIEISPDIIRQWVRDMGPALESKYPHLAMIIKKIDTDMANYMHLHMNIGREICRRFVEFCQEDK